MLIINFSIDDPKSPRSMLSFLFLPTHFLRAISCLSQLAVVTALALYAATGTRGIRKGGPGTTTTTTATTTAAVAASSSSSGRRLSLRRFSLSTKRSSNQTMPVGAAAYEATTEADAAAALDTEGLPSKPLGRDEARRRSERRVSDIKNVMSGKLDSFQSSDSSLAASASSAGGLASQRSSFTSSAPGWAMGPHALSHHAKAACRIFLFLRNSYMLERCRQLNWVQRAEDKQQQEKDENLVGELPGHVGEREDREMKEPPRP